jgi:hypothetical protein
MCLFNLYRSKKKIIVTGKIQPIGLAAVYEYMSKSLTIVRYVINICKIAQ